MSKDIYINIDRWGENKYSSINNKNNNILFITGLSGSGKTTSIIMSKLRQLKRMIVVILNNSRDNINIKMAGGHDLITLMKHNKYNKKFINDIIIYR